MFEATYSFYSEISLMYKGDIWSVVEKVCTGAEEHLEKKEH